MKVAIIGGGAAGMMAAATIKNAEVTLFEKNEKLGKKVYITGKGRCNVTNNCAIYEFVEKVSVGKKFLYSSLTAFPPPSLMEFLTANGTKVKTERGDRVFPMSDKSSDVIKAFINAINLKGANIHYNETVKSVSVLPSGEFVIKTNQSDYLFDKLIIATGGVSYKSTGSSGDGYKFAEKFNHTVVPPVPALCEIHLHSDVSPLEGLSLRNVKATVRAGGKEISEFGEMIFTSNGVSGPIILTLSSYINRLPLSGASLMIDFKPALPAGTLDERIQSDFGEMPNKSLSNILPGLLPKAIIPYVLSQSKISGDVRANSITKDMRHLLGFTIKNLYFTIKSLADINSAVVTSGGIKTTEINPTTMESKLIKGLYFIGEVLDVDALTGGYNLQIAFSTGFAAANHLNGLF